MSSDQRTAWVGLDLGGTKMLASVYDDEFQLLGRDRTKTRAADGVESPLERIVKTIGSAIEDAGLDQATVRGIGIGCPGPVDMDRGIVREALNLGWREVAVGDHLAASEATGHISHLPQATGRASLDSDRRLAAALDRLSGCEDRLARLEAIRDNPTA